jgi:C1A family cysteine protease
MFTLTLTFALAGPPEDLNQIRNAIANKRARWHADKTSVSDLSMEEKKMRLGLDENHPFGALSSPETAAIPTVTALAPTVDWRNVDGISYVSPIKNQGSCGSCWAFAETAALESQMMIATGGLPTNLSEQILVSCSGAGSCSGGYSSSASTFIQNVGLPVESCFPYTATNNTCSSACVNWQSNTEMVNGWHGGSSTVDGIRHALYAYGPVLATMYVYNDFYSYRSGVYSYTGGSYLGAHAVLVVGYNDVNQCFIVKNSWGTGWGESGYFQIAYTEVGGTSRFGYSVLVYDGYKDQNPQPDTTQPIVSIASPVSDATVSGTATVSVSATDNVGVTSVALLLDGNSLGSDSTAPFSFAWNTLTAVNGSHALQAVAYDAAGNSTTSASVSVTVNNVPDITPPKVSITSPLNGSTINKIIKVKVSASDSVAVKRVEAYVDGKLMGSATCTASSCSASFNLNAGSLAKGAHTITSYAYDAVANKGTASVSVNK